MVIALAYTSVDRIFNVEPQIGSVTTLSSSDIMTAFAEPAEAEINATLARNYAVPVSGTIPLLQAIADDISVYRILSRRIFTATQLEKSVWPEKFKESRQILKDLASGKLLLVDSAGTLVGTRTDIAEVKSNQSAFQPTFHESDPLDWVQDPDKIDEIRTNRGLR